MLYIHIKHTSNLEVPSAFFLQTQRSVTCYSSILHWTDLNILSKLHNMTEFGRWYNMQQNGFVVNKVIASGHHSLSIDV